MHTYWGQGSGWCKKCQLCAVQKAHMLFVSSLSVISYAAIERVFKEMLRFREDLGGRITVNYNCVVRGSVLADG